MTESEKMEARELQRFLEQQSNNESKNLERETYYSYRNDNNEEDM